MNFPVQQVILLKKRKKRKKKLIFKINSTRNEMFSFILKKDYLPLFLSLLSS